MAVTVLAIESSCDETAAAVCANGVIRSNIIASQSIHSLYGGVVPELASRAHMRHIWPVVRKALDDGQTRAEDISAVAFTRSPGLIGSLLVGAGFAKSLAQGWNVPLLAVDHMDAHVLANLIPESTNENRVPDFPFLCLTVSGGHTQIVRCDSPASLTLLGETTDDAAGEAFDKSAKLLGLPYPGGPLIDKYAAAGAPSRFPFPEPKTPGLNFSFSGLKTAILYFLQERTAADPAFVQNNLPDICASIQHRIVTILLNKLRTAARDTGIRTVCLAGGVAANRGLRAAFAAMGEREGWQVFVPRFEYCTDNAAMIAIAGYHKFLAGRFDSLETSARARS